MTVERIRSIADSTARNPRLRSVAGRLGPWAIVAAMALYLAYETGRYRLYGLPLGLLAGTAVVPFLLGTLALHRRGIRLSTVIRATILLAVLAASTVAAVLIVDHLMHWHLLNKTVVKHITETLRALGRVRVFGGSPFVLVVLGSVSLVLGAAAGIRRRERPSAVEVLVLVTLAWFVLSDLVLFQSVGLRDLRLDLRAGWFFDHGEALYLQGPLSVPPRDPTMLPFLYPPFSLPIFGFLSTLPFNLVAAGWLATSVAAAVAALRLFGLAWGWALLLLLWPAFAEGLYVGNVAVPAVLLFALGPWLGGALVLNGLLKLQSGIPALWLIRERRWRAVLAGVGSLAAICLLTLPLVGIQRWVEWVHGLQYYEQSQSAIHGLYGFALPSMVPYPVYIGLTLLAIGAALARSGRQGLARFGVATVVGSPSLFTHGFLVALPAFLSLRSLWLWVVLAFTATVLGPGWWAAIVVVAVGWFVPALRREFAPNEGWHPLGAVREPWVAHRWPAIGGIGAAGRPGVDGEVESS